MSRGRVTAFLLILFCLAIVYAWWAFPRQHRVLPNNTTRQTETTGSLVSSEEDTGLVDLNVSGRALAPFSAPKKNLFSGLYPAPPEPKKTAPVPKPKKIIRKVVPPPQPKPVTILADRPEPIPTYKVLGFLGKAGAHTVFLASKQGEVYLVKKGEVFADDLLLSEISAQEVTIRKEKTGQQVTLRLRETKSQRLPRDGFTSGRPQFVPQEFEEKKNTPDNDPAQMGEKVKDDDMSK